MDQLQRRNQLEPFIPLNNMRIGIFTQPLTTNYGGILQNYALHTVLRTLGHDPITLERPIKIPQQPLWRIPLSTAKRTFKHYIVHDRSSFPPLFEWRVNRALPTITCHTRKFVAEHIATRMIKSSAEILPTDFEAFVVGSDQVWRPKYNTGILSDMYLTFSSGWDVKRIAYAASFGTDSWELSPTDTEYYKPFAEHFDAISVRESTAVDLIANHYGTKAVQVLDPTMLLTRDIYTAIAQKMPPSSGNLMVHILDATDEKSAVAKRIEQDFSLRPFSVCQEYSEYEVSKPISKRIQPPVEQWLRGFMDAEAVFTDSFHACVFAILFNKPLIVFCNKERGASRFKSLLTMVGLEQSLITSKEDYAANMFRNIDFDKVNQRIEQWRDFSMDFLRKALE